VFLGIIAKGFVANHHAYRLNLPLTLFLPHSATRIRTVFAFGAPLHLQDQLSNEFIGRFDYRSTGGINNDPGPLRTLMHALRFPQSAEHDAAKAYHCLVVAKTTLQEEITKHRVQGNGQQQPKGEDEQVNRRALIHLVAVRIMTEWRTRPD
jgi:hypothetical protein